MKDELLFCPLGGSGEIGMNMNLFGYGQPSDHKWIMVDIGVTFADDSIPGIDLIYPDPGFIIERKENLLDAMAKVVIEDNIDEVLLFIVDILEQESTLLVQNKFVHTIAKKSFGVEPSSDIVKLPGIVSRKKQIIPNIKL